MTNRKVPSGISVPEIPAPTKAGWITMTRHYKVITPLWGGGVEPNTKDPVKLIRGSEIRGNLRFWWRALRGNQRGPKLSDMRELENSIWGSTENPSPVSISVNVEGIITEIPPEYYRGERINIGHYRSRDSYVTFPLRKTDSMLWEGVKFDLTVKYPIDIGVEVEAALWAWETFGGIGARTRRGFGAIECVNIECTNTASKKFIKLSFEEKLAEIKSRISDNSFPPGVSHLSKDMQFKLIDNTNNHPMGAMEALRDLVKEYRRFRQSRNDENRSEWPEPDIIRRNTKGYWRHKPEHKVVAKMPRAVFGLPIVFEFKRYDHGRQDPEKTTLQGKGEIDRMASPLILRPIALANGNYAGLALQLNWTPINTADPYTPPEGLSLRDKDGKPLKDKVTKKDLALSSKLTQEEADSIFPLDGEPDPLKAFFISLEKLGRKDEI